MQDTPKRDEEVWMPRLPLGYLATGLMKGDFR